MNQEQPRLCEEITFPGTDKVSVDALADQRSKGQLVDSLSGFALCVACKSYVKPYGNEPLLLPPECLGIRPDHGLPTT